MSDVGNALRAGIVIVVGVCIALYFFFSSKKTSLDDSNSVAYYALLSDAAGVNAKSLITIAGLQVGEIKNIQLQEVPLAEYIPDFVPRAVENLTPVHKKDELGLPQRLVEAHDDFDQMIVLFAERHRLPKKDTLVMELQRKLKTGELSDADVDGQLAWVRSEVEKGATALLKEKVRVARVDMRINGDVKIPADTWVRKESLGLLGAKALFLELGPSQTLVQNGGRIVNVRSSTGMDALLARASGIVSDVESITHKLDQDIGGITGDIKGITGELNRFVTGDKDHPPLDELYKLVMTDLRKLSNTVERAVRDANGLINENDGEFKKLVANLSKITGDIADLTAKGDPTVGPDGKPLPEGDVRATMGSVRKVADDLAVVTGQLKDALTTQEGKDGVQELKTTIAELNRSLTSLSEVMGRVERGEGTVGRLLTDEAMADKVESAVSGAADYVSSLTSIEAHVDVGAWYNMNKQITTAMLSLKLQPRPDKYYLIEIVDDGGKLERNTEIDVATGQRRESIREEDNQIRITANFAKKFWDFLVLRAGLIESTGGVGANAYFLSDRIELRTDVFNVGGPRDTLKTERPPNWYLPRWRSMIKAQPIPYLYVSAGVDDVLNAYGPGGFQQYTPLTGYGFDYFFGVGLTFKDEDLRSILPFIPGG